MDFWLYGNRLLISAQYHSRVLTLNSSNMGVFSLTPHTLVAMMHGGAYGEGKVTYPRLHRTRAFPAHFGSAQERSIFAPTGLIRLRLSFGYCLFPL